MKRLWRIAGALCIAHVVLLLAGYSQQRSPVFGASPGAIASLYAGMPATRTYTGGFLVTLAWLVLLAAVTLAARLLRGPGDTAGWFASLILAAGTTATVVTLAGSYATAGAAYFAASHGYSADVVAGVSMISKFSDFIAIVASGLCALAVGAAGLAGRRLPRWAAWTSVAAGVAGLAAGTGSGPLNAGTLVWLGWLVMIGVVLMRGPARRAPSASGSEADGHLGRPASRVPAELP
jgi:hypothetical protein